MINFINIVLYNPEIPQNAGNIARMCVANDLKLHFIEPLGFEISDKYLKRSALDYWEFLNYQVHKSWEDFISTVEDKSRIWFLTTKSSKSFWDVKFSQGDYLVFGPETKGLPMELMQTKWDNAITVPMSSNNSRSLNLASTVQTVYYEAFRQLKYS
jgi:tRNA (cytidine/uridine-2'-O-)-methyltransferase